MPIGLLDGMERNLQAWRETHFVSEAGCFYQSDTWDGGEDSISGGGCRVSINSVMASARPAWRLQTVQYVRAVARERTPVSLLSPKAVCFPQPSLVLLPHAEGVLMQYGELAALAAVQELAGLHQQATKTKAQAASFRQHILQLLWDPELQFFAGLNVALPSTLKHVPGVPPNSRSAFS